MKDLKDYSLLKHNTFGIEARCSRFLEYSTLEEAQQVAQILQSGDTPYIIIGGGSNLLLTRDFCGTVVHSAVKGIEREGETLLRCGSGEVWDDVVAYCVEHEMWGAENLSLIPGDVGASAVQNIGAYGVEVKDIIDTVHAFDRAERRFVIIPGSACGYGYRTSHFKTGWKGRYCVTAVTFRLSRSPKPVLDYGGLRKVLEAEHPGSTGPDGAGLTPQRVRDTVIGIRQKKLPRRRQRRQQKTPDQNTDTAEMIRSSQRFIPT